MNIFLFYLVTVAKLNFYVIRNIVCILKIKLLFCVQNNPILPTLVSRGE